jgi:nicotinamide mononucleotide transporter PnuC
MKNWWNSITMAQKLWIICSTLAIAILGVVSGDSWVNVLIGTVGMFYVSVYSTGARGAFLLGVAYVGLYTIICLQNRIMLDAIQNIVLIPLYIYSFIYWGKNNVTPRNINKKQSAIVLLSAVVVMVVLWGLSKLLHGNYSELDALNTTCTLYAMVLGLYGISLNWCLWTINNVASALTFGLALATPTGSITVFAMKMIFLINGLIGWYNFTKMGKEGVLNE